MAPVARPRQVALVTGSASGLGAALCVELASRGYAVAATARAGSSDPRLTETVARAREAAGGDEGAAAAFQCDVTSPTSCAACVERVVGELGPVDLLVCNAGGTRFGPMLEQPVDEVRAVFEANVFGVLHTIQAAMPSMCERRRGKVLIIGSVSATLTTPFAGAYSASKAAVHEIAEALRMEVERYSVSVSVAVLGSFKSGFSETGRAAMQGVEGSALYSDVAEALEARTFASQQGNIAQPPQRVAKDLVDAMSKPKPLAFIGAAGSCTKFRLLGFLQKNLWPWTYVQKKLAAAHGLA